MVDKININGSSGMQGRMPVYFGWGVPPHNLDGISNGTLKCKRFLFALYFHVTQVVVVEVGEATTVQQNQQQH